MISKPTLRAVANVANNDAQPFFLVVIDEDRGVFCIEGPITDDRRWQAAARNARDHRGHRVLCGPRGADRDELAAEFRST